MNQIYEIINRALEYGGKYVEAGKVASYIPQLAKMRKDRLGVAVCLTDGRMYCAGDCDEKFTIQSISKIICLILAIEQNGLDYVFSKVGFEPTGDAFNSMVRLDCLTNNKPFNPMINAGAIVVASCIRGGTLEERLNTGLSFARKLFNNRDIHFNTDVYLSEKGTGYKNRAIINLMKSNGIIEGDTEQHLDLYFSMCSIEATCKDLAFLAAVLANDGCHPETKERMIPPKTVKLVRSLMVTCGMYDYSGEFASKVGIPSKSGVGGGIMSSAIDKMGIAVYGPALDEKGNSIGGIKILEYLSDELELNMF